MIIITITGHHHHQTISRLGAELDSLRDIIKYNDDGEEWASTFSSIHGTVHNHPTAMHVHMRGAKNIWKKKRDWLEHPFSPPRPCEQVQFGEIFLEAERAMAITIYSESSHITDKYRVVGKLGKKK